MSDPDKRDETQTEEEDEKKTGREEEPQRERQETTGEDEERERRKKWIVKQKKENLLYFSREREMTEIESEAKKDSYTILVERKRNERAFSFDSSLPLRDDASLEMLSSFSQPLRLPLSVLPTSSSTPLSGDVGRERNGPCLELSPRTHPAVGTRPTYTRRKKKKRAD